MLTFLRRSLSWAPLLGLVLVTACLELDTPPAGSYSEVLLVLEEGEKSPWAEEVTRLITHEMDYVISNEQAFKVTVIPAAGLEDFPVVKNIVLCGVLDASTRVGERIMSLISTDSEQRVMSGQASILKRDNLPAPGQVTLIVTAPDDEALGEVLRTRGEELPDILEQSCRERLRRYLLQNEAAQLSEDIHRKYGFALDIPTLYRLASENEDPAGIELIREGPARVLGVFWRDWKTPPSLYKTEELFDMRAEYVWARYDHDKMDRDRVRYTWTKFGAYDAIRMAGYWYNDKAVAGGYFETYFIYDKDNRLLWAVDLLAYAPGREKHSLIRELHAIGETFRYD